jgi:hypothetical protein
MHVRYEGAALCWFFLVFLVLGDSSVVVGYRVAR